MDSKGKDARRSAFGRFRERKWSHPLIWLGLQLLFPILPLVATLGIVHWSAIYHEISPLRTPLEIADEALLGLIGMAMLGNSIAGYHERAKGAAGSIILGIAYILLLLVFGAAFWASWARFSDFKVLEDGAILLHSHTKMEFRVLAQAYLLVLIVPLCFVMDHRKKIS